MAMAMAMTMRGWVQSSRCYHTLPSTKIPKLNKQVTRIGFGAYRVCQPEHQGALEEALKSGVSTIDMGSNFENGKSEILVGETLQSMIKTNQVDRQSLTLVGKAGYMNTLPSSLTAKDYVKINDTSFHGISPRVLEHELHQTLERLGMASLDVFMINAPERMLLAKDKRYTTTDLYKQLEESFQFLDTMVDKGHIHGYGVCSNTMALNGADHISLHQVIKACSRPDHLVAIQVPFNLFEREAVVASGHAPDTTVAAIAKAHDIHVMTNRPLNSISNGQIRTLVNYSLEGNNAEHRLMENMTKAFQHIAHLESEMLSELPLEEDTLSSKFVWGQVLSENLSRLAQNHFATRHYFVRHVSPAVQQDLSTLATYAANESEEIKVMYEDWSQCYAKGIQALTHAIEQYAYMDTLRKNNELNTILHALCPCLPQHPHAHSPLSVAALEILLAHPIGTVYTGMRQPVYVKDALMASHGASDSPLKPDSLENVWQCPVF
ncbi:NADP-dependent oxidoreductase domain-containing protein [Spinellus fusiger]|nr:NADP-dependent oxidoreductase domain-containing protein [Spinellus fusiger]